MDDNQTECKTTHYSPMNMVYMQLIREFQGELNLIKAKTDDPTGLFGMG